MARKKTWPIALLLMAIGAVGGGYYYFQILHTDSLPDTIATGNGRIEVEEIHVAAKYGGRIAEVLVDEGDMVEADDVLARLDTTEREANLERVHAETNQAEEAVAGAEALIAQRESDVIPQDDGVNRSQDGPAPSIVKGRPWSIIAASVRRDGVGVGHELKTSSHFGLL